MADKINRDEMVPWEQTQEAMDLGDSHPEDDIWVDADGNPSQGTGSEAGSEAGSGDSRITDEGQAGSPAEVPEGEYQGDQEEPETAPGGPQETQEGAQEGEGAPGEEMLSVDDPAQAQQLLQNVDKMDRPHLMQVAKLIWGDDYEPEEWATDDYLREDVRGSLMDIIEGQGGTAGSEEEE